jgi:uncharacterized protein (TIGR03663 family)
MNSEKLPWLHRPIHPSLPAITNEIALFAGIILLAIVTRFYDLGTRVMSHDESLHTYFSWLLYRGQGYQHTPMMHGPYQFHIIALSYFLFGVSDFTARIPAVLFSIGTVWMVWYWRKFLGNWGMIVAALLMVISPYMLYYGRYVRNESFAGFAGILLLYSMLRYMENGRKKYLYLVTTATLLHFTSKETAFIYTAQALLFLGVYFLVRLAYTRNFPSLRDDRVFGLMILLGTFVLPMLVPFPIKWLESSLQVSIPTEAAQVQLLDARALWIIGGFVALFLALSILVGMLWNREWWKYGVFFWGIFTILYTTVFTNPAGFFTGIVGSLGYWLVQQGVERGSQPEYFYWLVQIPMYEFLPALGSIFAAWIGFKKLSRFTPPQPASETSGTLPVEADDLPVDAPAEVAATPDLNFINMFSLLVFWSATSIAAFSIAGERMPWLTYHMAWPMILLTGWGVGQIIEAALSKFTEDSPWRPALVLFILTVFTVALFNLLRSIYGATPPFQGTSLEQLQATSAFIFPLVTAIGSGALLFMLTRKDLGSLAIVASVMVLVVAFSASVLNGAQLLQTQTGAVDPTMAGSYGLKFGAAFVGLLACILGTILFSRIPRKSPLMELAALTIFGLLAVQTARTSFRAAYINYDNATEYLVYAHGAGGVKDVITQVTEISERTAGGLNAVIAYDASAPDTGVSWPVVWYLRDFTQQRSFDQPTRSLREAVAVIVDQKNFDKIDAALGDGFYRFDYIRMWWPNQDYFGLEQTRVLNAITNSEIRAGIFDIWFDRDYTRYAQATGSSSMTLTTWQPADQMRLYVRKDVASQIWNYGVGPSESSLTADPYEGGVQIISADQIFNSDRYLPLGLNAPRGISYGANVDLYIADSRNHRILHIASDGSLLQEWGKFADLALGDAPPGTFNEPWGVAVGPDGSVYVTDTWNHRVQKFTRDGTPITSWGQFGQPAPELPDSNYLFWGPRGIAVDSNGRVFVADTGNKRILVYDENGNYLTEFGTGGFDPGQFDEPVGIAVGSDGVVYVTDTWNQRVQSFILTEGTELLYLPLAQWDVNGWFGQSLDNKPFLAVGNDNHVYITDPEGFRVIEFTSSGEFVRTWGDFGTGPDQFGLLAGIAVDPLGSVWVVDAGNNRILRFTLP